MPMNIDSSEAIRDIFSIFHDGIIARAFSDDSDIILDIEIRYLAEQINPSYERFLVRLESVRDIGFTTWPKDIKSEPWLITDMSVIFKPELEILEGNIEDSLIQVICNQASPDFDYCGGELYFQARSAQVTDDGGQNYSMNQLKSLFKGYWDNWSNKNRA